MAVISCDIWLPGIVLIIIYTLYHSHGVTGSAWKLCKPLHYPRRGRLSRCVHPLADMTTLIIFTSDLSHVPTSLAHAYIWSRRYADAVWGSSSKAVYRWITSLGGRLASRTTLLGRGCSGYTVGHHLADACYKLTLYTNNTYIHDHGGHLGYHADDWLPSIGLGTYLESLGTKTIIDHRTLDLTSDHCHMIDLRTEPIAHLC